MSSAAPGLVLRLIMGLGPMPRRPLEHRSQPMESLRGFRWRLGDFALRIHLRKRELRAVFPPVNPGGASAGYTVGVGRIGWSCRRYRFVSVAVHASLTSDRVGGTSKRAAPVFDGTHKSRGEVARSSGATAWRSSSYPSAASLPAFGWVPLSSKRGEDTL